MQHTNSKAITSICTSPSGAVPTSPVVIVDSYINTGYDSTTGITGGWYRKYSDGRIEQGGYISGGLSQNSEKECSFVTPFTTSNVNVFLTLNFTSGASISGIHGGLAVSSLVTSTVTSGNETITVTSGFVVHNDTYGSNTDGFYWEATGV